MHALQLVVCVYVSLYNFYIYSILLLSLLSIAVSLSLYPVLYASVLYTFFPCIDMHVYGTYMYTCTCICTCSYMQCTGLGNSVNLVSYSVFMYTFNCSLLRSFILHNIYVYLHGVCMPYVQTCAFTMHAIIDELPHLSIKLHTHRPPYCVLACTVRLPYISIYHTHKHMHMN